MYSNLSETLQDRGQDGNFMIGEINVDDRNLPEAQSI